MFTGPGVMEVASAKAAMDMTVLTILLDTPDGDDSASSVRSARARVLKKMTVYTQPAKWARAPTRAIISGLPLARRGPWQRFCGPF
ncbi:hypothetical protein PT2222_100289 [Paraburkholderia tropica]